MGEYSNMLSRLPAISVENGNDDLWVGILESVKRIDHIDYELKYQWVFWLPFNDKSSVKYYINKTIIQSYNHLDAMTVGYKRNTNTEKMCIKLIFEFY